MINEQQHAPTLEQYKVINDCLKYFEQIILRYKF